MDETIQSHNQKPASVWSSGGSAYDAISRGIADSIEHCVLRLAPKQGERILDLATGTGWTSRAVARSGAKVVGVDIAADLVAAAKARAAADRLAIEYRIGDAEKLPFADGEFDAVISTCGSCSQVGKMLRRRNSVASAGKAAASP
jgi:ubiquinone/menaquinone biosynthesis C-methylase UbiE